MSNMRIRRRCGDGLAVRLGLVISAVLAAALTACGNTGLAEGASIGAGDERDPGTCGTNETTQYATGAFVVRRAGIFHVGEHKDITVNIRVSRGPTPTGGETLSESGPYVLGPDYSVPGFTVDGDAGDAGKGRWVWVSVTSATEKDKDGSPKQLQAVHYENICAPGSNTGGGGNWR